MSDCYKICNKKYNLTDPKRTFCKKGCDSDESEMEKCKEDTCASKCIKSELGDEESQLGSWSKIFSRAPKDPAECLDACYYGCNNKEFDNDDDKKKD